MDKLLLEVKGLHTSFFGDSGEVKAVDGVNIVIREGETLGIVGESGCGKSVTALSIMRLFHDTSGRIKSGKVQFNGLELTEISAEKMRGIRGNEISMIFQEPMTSLNPVLKVGEQIEEAVRLHLKYESNQARKRVIEMLTLVGIPRADEIYSEYPYQLSGGMRQRVMIAMAMSCKPKLLIADEPTTALDVTIQAQILNLMLKLKKSHNMSVMLITHDLAVVAEMCDRALVMYAGRVVEEADIFQLFEKPMHPYTKGLHTSIPKMEQKVRRLASIRGVVPNPQQMPLGCKFAPRCDEVMDCCWENEPEFYEPEPGHRFRCWLYHKQG